VSRTILIVDDEVHLRTLIHQTLEELEDEGVELMTAANGEEALAIIESVKPNLVFLDVMMPKLSGFDVCSRAKQTLGLKDVYIVLLTAKGQEFDRQRGQEVGADLYMKRVVVVDHDVDVFDDRQVNWALATRCQPDRDITVITHARGSDLDPSTKEDGYSAKWGVDATAKPSLAAYTPRHRVPPEVAQRLDLKAFGL